MALSDLFSSLTGSASKDAADRTQSYLTGVGNRVTGVLGDARTGGLDALQRAELGGLADLRSGYQTARGDIQGSIDPQLQALIEGYSANERNLGIGQTNALATLNEGVAAAGRAYDPLAEAGSRYGALGSEASNMVANALGLRGPEGNAAAMAAFQPGPGYQWEKNQALEGVLRNAAASGMAAGGNQLAEAGERAGQFANRAFYKDWLPGVERQGQFYAGQERGALGDVATGRANAALTGGTGGANIITGTTNQMVQNAMNAARDKAAVYGGGAKTLADLSSRGGEQAANLQQGTGGRVADFLRGLAGTEVSSMGDLAKPYVEANETRRRGIEGSSSNIMNLIGGLATGGAGMGWFNNLPGLSGLQSYVMAGRNRPAPYAAG